MTKYILIVISLISSLSAFGIECKFDSDCTDVVRSCLVFGINKKDAISFAKFTNPQPNVCLTKVNYNQKRICYVPKCSFLKCSIVESECRFEAIRESFNIGSSLYISPDCTIPGYVFGEDLLNVDSLDKENIRLDLYLKYLKRVATTKDWKNEKPHVKCIISDSGHRVSNSKLSDYYSIKMKEAADVIVSSKNIEFLKLIEELVEKSPGNGFWLADGNYEIISSFGNKNKINFLRSYIHVGKNLEPALKDLLSLPNEVLKVEWDSLKETLGRLLSNPAHLKWFLKEIYSNKLNHVPADLKIYLDQKDLSTKKEVLKFLSNNQQSPWGCTLGEAASRIFNGKDDIELYKPFAKTEFPCLKKHLGFIGQQLILANDSCSQKLNNFSKFLKEFPGFEFHNFEKLLSNCSTFCESKSDCSYGECTLSQPRNVAFRDVYKNNCNRDSKSEIRAPSDVQCLKNHCIESGIKPNDCSASKVFSNIKNEISKRGGFSCKTNNDCIRSNSHPFRFYTNDQFEKSFKLRIVDDYTYRCKNSELKDFPSRLFSNDEQPALCTNGQCVNNLNVDAKIKAFNSYQIECEKEIQIEKTGVFINACKFAKANKTRIEEADYLIYDLLRSCGANDYLERRNPNLQKPSAEQLKCALNRYQQSPYFKSNQ